MYEQCAGIPVHCQYLLVEPGVGRSWKISDCSVKLWKPLPITGTRDGRGELGEARRCQSRRHACPSLSQPAYIVPGCLPQACPCLPLPAPASCHAEVLGPQTAGWAAQIALVAEDHATIRRVAFHLGRGSPTGPIITTEPAPSLSLLESGCADRRLPSVRSPLVCTGPKCHYQGACRSARPPRATGCHWPLACLRAAQCPGGLLLPRRFKC